MKIGWEHLSPKNVNKRNNKNQVLHLVTMIRVHMYLSLFILENETENQ